MSDGTPICETCGKNIADCDCDERLVQHLGFEGGPLDGCCLIIPGDVFIGDIFIGFPVRMDGDKNTSMSGEAIHQYTVCNSSRLEGSTVVNHFMGHVAVRKVSLNAINKVFQSSQKITLENQQWIDDVNAAVERIQGKDIGFDIDNNDETDEEREQDGEGWKN